MASFQHGEGGPGVEDSFEELTAEELELLEREQDGSGYALDDTAFGASDEFQDLEAQLVAQLALQRKLTAMETAAHGDTRPGVPKKMNLRRAPGEAYSEGKRA